MATYLLDTDHLSYVQERHPRVLARLGSVRSEDRLLTSVIGIGELLKGVYLLPNGKRRRELLSLYHRAIEDMDEILPISRPVAEKFAEIDATLRRTGRPIPVNDLWVAAVALLEDAVLVTGDEHFSYVGGLKTENWTR